MEVNPDPKRTKIGDSSIPNSSLKSSSSSASNSSTSKWCIDNGHENILTNELNDSNCATNATSNILNVEWPVTPLISPNDMEFAESCTSDTWHSYKSAIFKFAHRPPDQLAGKKEQAPVGVLAFDMDGTLIRTKSGKKFARDEEYVTDWTLWDSSIPAALKSWHDRGYLLAIIR